MNEALLHERVCMYLKTHYPDVIFTSEASGYYATIGQAAKRKRTRSRRGLPDLIILAQRRGYAGLMIELKAENKSPYKKNGELKTSEHIQEQAEVLRELEEEGYFATFCVGFGEAVAVIDNYFV